ncbi:MAG: translocation/assembly module TamB, partial [Chloroflexi bacterium]|nr:translocation/assembly module TamB [Chloroflexota bacterium]
QLDTGRGGGYVNYYVGFWRLENSVTDIHYQPPTDPTASGLDIYLHAVLTTQISESTPSTSSVSFFGPSGQSLQVTMEVDGRPFVPDGFHILSLTSDPPRPRSELEQLILHEQALQNILAGNTQAAIPGLFNEVVRQSLTGSLLAPWEMQIASSLGLEELNVSYDFGGPLFVEVSRHLFGGVSARLRQAVTGGSSEYQYYFDYRLKGSMTLSFGLLQRPTYQEESLTLQSFLRF